MIAPIMPNLRDTYVRAVESARKALHAAQAALDAYDKAVGGPSLVRAKRGKPGDAIAILMERQPMKVSELVKAMEDAGYSEGLVRSGQALKSIRMQVGKGVLLVNEELRLKPKLQLTELDLNESVRIRPEGFAQDRMAAYEKAMAQWKQSGHWPDD